VCLTLSRVQKSRSLVHSPNPMTLRYKNPSPAGCIITLRQQAEVQLSPTRCGHLITTKQLRSWRAAHKTSGRLFNNGRELCKVFEARACLRPLETDSTTFTHMAPHNEQLGDPGPFEVRFSDVEDAAPCEGEGSTSRDEMPRRRYDCACYERCLELAAALNWESFTCRGCNGVVNESLLWRVGQAIRRDSVAKALCAAPKIPTLSCASETPPNVTSSPLERATSPRARHLKG